MTWQFWLASSLAAYFFLGAMYFGVRERRGVRLIKAMAERIEIQSRLLSLKAERGRIIPPQGGSGTAPPQTLNWTTISKPGDPMTIRTAPIPPAIQERIAAALDGTHC